MTAISEVCIRVQLFMFQVSIKHGNLGRCCCKLGSNQAQSVSMVSHEVASRECRVGTQAGPDRFDVDGDGEVDEDELRLLGSSVAARVR